MARITDMEEQWLETLKRDNERLTFIQSIALRTIKVGHLGTMG